MAASIIVHAVTTILAVQLYVKYRAEMAEGSSASLTLLVLLLVAVYILIYGFAFVLGLILSHRIYGPLVNFEKALRKFKEGDFSARVHLRKNDDGKLKEVAELLNSLAADLETKAR